MVKTFKVLICLILFVSILPTKSSAATPYDHQELSQYKGYGEVMYDSIVEQTTFVTGQYTDNKQYVKDSMSKIGDYADFWYNEHLGVQDVCKGTLLFTKDCLGEITSSAGGYALTVGDFVKNLFNDANESEEIAPLPTYHGVMKTIAGYTNLNVPNTHKMVFSHQPDKSFSGFTGLTFTVRGNDIALDVAGKAGPFVVGKKETEKHIWETLFNNFKASDNASAVFPLLSYFGITVTVLPNGEVARPFNENFNAINDYVQREPVKTIMPQPKAYLSCPDGTRVDMAINGSTFLDASGQVMQLSKDGVAVVSSEICNLNWEKPQIDYVDDKTVITDPNGNWIDAVTGLLLCLATDTCVKEDDKNEIEPLDTSLLQYVKNAYEYATGTLKVATDGLKSLALGAKDLTLLFGVFFSWLPTEMVVLMSSGLGIMIALRIFRK